MATSLSSRGRNKQTTDNIKPILLKYNNIIFMYNTDCIARYFTLSVYIEHNIDFKILQHFTMPKDNSTYILYIYCMYV